MSGTLLTTRSRSFSQASIRKRMLRSSSQHQSQKQLIKNSTMTSFKPKLQRLIHQGKIQQIINSDKHSKANLLYSSHINDMQKQLANTKKSLSTMVLKAKSKQFNINKLKDQIARLEKQKEIIKINNQVVNKLFDNTAQKLDSKKETKQNAQWVEKSYIYMKDRLLKDQYFHKVKYQTNQKLIEAQRIRTQFLEKKSQQILSQQKQLERAVNQAKHISSQQTHLKNQFIDLINQQRQEKQFLNDLRIDKQKRQTSINELSSWVIQKQELAKYLNILYTHRMLSQIIRTKNSHLMKKYSEVQAAYMHIKSNTNIIEFEKILRKMEEQDSIYDITVKKVSDLQNELSSMQKQIQIAKKQRNKILSQQGKLNHLQKDYYQGIQKDKYEMILSQKEKVEFRINQDQIMKQRIIEWGNRLTDKLKVIKRSDLKFQDSLKHAVQMLKGKKK